MSNIRDVAKKAGVAPITVSRVINKTDYVSQKTRQRVEAAIEELGYVPNMLGPSLRFKQTMTIALVITDITNPFWTTVARGVEDVAQASGYSTILCNTDESEEKQAQYLQMLLRRRIDGILIVPASSNAAPIHLIQKQKIPVIVLDRNVPNIAVDIVRGNSEDGAYEITKHLLSLGHTHIAMLTGPDNVSTAVDRATGYRRALDEAGITDKQIVWGHFSRESGYEMAATILNRPIPPTAIFAANNFVAIGVLHYLEERGLVVPDDMSLVTFDDIPRSFMLNPFFTVIQQPARQIGQTATQLLLERMSGTTQKECQHIILPTEMIIRSSSSKRTP